MKMSSKKKARVVIVGAGFAGIEIAKSLRNYKGVDLTLISKTDIFEYYPALYRLVTGALPIEVSVPIKKIFPTGVALVTATYTGMDQERQVISVTNAQGVNSEIPYDYLVLALGSETNYFNIPGLSENSFSFKSVKEALRLKKHFYESACKAQKLTKDEAVAMLHTIVVGGGPSGVELAGDLKHYLMRLCKDVGTDPSLVTIDIIESNGRLLPTFSEKVSAVAEARLRKMGVNIFTNRALQSQELADIALKDMEMKVGTVVWTAGTRINTAYTAITTATFDARKRVEVGEYLTLPNDNHVFIAGDGAGTVYSGLAQTAIHNGTYIAKTIIRMIEDTPVFPYVPKRPSFAVPIGDNWAVISSGSIVLTGYLPWIIRHMIDFKYFVSIVPLSYVFAVFRKGYKYRTHETCVIPDVGEK